MAARGPPRRPDGLPGPVRLAQPTPPGRLHHRRPLRDPPCRQPCRAEAFGPGPHGARGAQPRALQPVPCGVLRRSATADRRRAGPGAPAQAHHLRRARLRPRRLDPGPGHQPAHRPAGRVRTHLRLHLARPVRRPTRQRPDRRHVPRQGRRGGTVGAPLRRPAPPLHAGPPVGPARRRPRHVRQSRADRPCRRPADTDASPGGLPVPHSLPEGPARTAPSPCRRWRRSSATGRSTRVACRHPLQQGEDLTASTPQVDDSEIGSQGGAAYAGAATTRERP